MDRSAILLLLCLALAHPDALRAGVGDSGRRTAGAESDEAGATRYAPFPGCRTGIATHMTVPLLSAPTRVVGNVGNSCMPSVDEDPPRMIARSMESGNRIPDEGSPEANGGLYHSALTFGGMYRNYPMSDRDWANQGEYGIAVSHAYTLLPHDDAHRTHASAAVIPTSSVDARINLGPRYPQSPEQMDVRLSGAALVSSTLAIGALATFQGASKDLIYYIFSDGSYYATAWSIGPMLDAFLSPTIRVREAVTVGQIDVRFSAGDWNVTDASGLYRFEHMLSMAPSTDLGYTHMLRFQYAPDNAAVMEFENYLEYAPSAVVSIVPIAGVLGRFRDGGDPLWRMDLGAGAIVYPSPLISISVLPRYVYNMENGDLSTIEVPISLGVRF